METLRVSAVYAVAVCVLAGIFKGAKTEFTEVCSREEFSIECGVDEVILITSAEYGRPEIGRCITEMDEFMGCTNVVLPLVDRWCSGRQTCSFGVPNKELKASNTQCQTFLEMYLAVSYNCVRVQACDGSQPTTLSRTEGIIASTLCPSPWVISADPGQTVNITMLDFAASPEDGSVVTCRNVYGYILERALDINHTICGGGDREVALYASKANLVEIYIRREQQLMLQYFVFGCKDLRAPPNAWYKREGSEALIGCETNNQQWRLTCTGNTWHGTVGNCSAPPPDVIDTIRENEAKETTSAMPSLVLLTGIGAAALVIIVIVIMLGVVYVKKQRIREETKKMTLTYPTMDKHPPAYYRPVSTGQPTTFGKVPDNMSGSWEMTFPPRADTTTSYPAPCACSTLPYRPDANHTRSMSAASSDGTTYETPKFVDSVPLNN